MKLPLNSLIAAAIGAAALTPALAQERIFRCGNEYINNAVEAQTRGCKLVEGGNVTVVTGTKPQQLPVAGQQGAVRVASAGPAGGPRVDGAEQRARDSDSRAILETELKKAEARQADLAAEYNKGEPEKRGDEGRNYQKYLDRTTELKSSLARNESDIAGIKRELARLPAAK